ncbi:MAG: cysteine hydrolase family protein [Gammaproteobacteria bacterium]
MSAQALILVDIQNDYFPGGAMELVGMEQAASNAASILSGARKADMPIFHIQHIAVSEGATFFVPNSNGAEHHQLVRPGHAETVIQKHFPNAFRGTDLQTRLNRLGISDVCIVGAMSHMCIDATTRAAFDAGFNCTVVQDACATRDLTFNGHQIDAADVHGAFMAALSSPYATIINTGNF